MAESANVVLKISFVDQLRRTQLTRQPLSIAEVREQVSQLFPDVKYYTLSYVDEEGDKITVSTDLELQEAHRVCHPNVRLTLEKLDQPTPSSLVSLPAGSLLDHVSPAIASPAPAPAPALAPSSVPSAIAALFPPVGSLLNYISPVIDEDVEFQKDLEKIMQQEKEEKEEKERREKEAREQAEREEKERQEREERERLEKERLEKERLERERLEREEKERREKEAREEKERLEKEKLAFENQQNLKEQTRNKILESNVQCGEILEKLLSEGVELELAWQALEYSNYSNEKRVRDLLKMNELGIEFKAASDALTKFHTVDEAMDSLLG